MDSSKTSLFGLNAWIQTVPEPQPPPGPEPSTGEGRAGEHGPVPAGEGGGRGRRPGARRRGGRRGAAPRARAGSGCGSEPRSRSPPAAAQPPWSGPRHRPRAVAMQQAALLGAARRTASAGRRHGGSLLVGLPGLPPPLLSRPLRASATQVYGMLSPPRQGGGWVGEPAQTKEGCPPPPPGGVPPEVPSAGSRREGAPRRHSRFPLLPPPGQWGRGRALGACG